MLVKNCSILSATLIVLSHAFGIAGIVFIKADDSLSNDPVSAVNCSLCSPGYGAVSSCTRDADTQCARCSPGYFSSNTSSGPCKQCSSCHDNEYEVKSCSPTSDVVCRKCSSCDSGFGLVEPCGKRSDTVCGLCPESNGVRYPLDKCRPCIQCPVKGDQAEIQVLRSQLAIDLMERNVPVDAPPTKTEIPVVALAGGRRPWHRDKPALVQHNDQLSSPDLKMQCCLVLAPPQPSSKYIGPSSDASISSAPGTDQHSERGSAGVLATTRETSRSAGPELDRTKGSEHVYRPSPKFVDGPTDRPATTKRLSRRRRPRPNDYPADHGTAVAHDEAGEESKTSQGTNLHKKSVAKKIEKNKETGGVVYPRTSEPTGYLSSTPEDLEIFPPRYGVTSVAATVPASTRIIGTVRRSDEDKARSSTSKNSVAVAVVVGVVIVATCIVLAKRHISGRRKATDSEYASVPTPPVCVTSPDCCDGVSETSFPVEYYPSPLVHCDNEQGNQDNVKSKINQKNTPTEVVVAADVHGVIQETVESFQICCFDPCLKVQRTFDSNGGRLSARNSDIFINVDPGTIPHGATQTLFFRVIYDERPLLGKLPEGPERTLISPVFECGPSDIVLTKPVEIVVPHCLCDLSNQETIKVFRCDHQPGFPNGDCDWEEVPLASGKKKGRSKAWFTADEDAVHIRTSSFSIWCIFACGAGPKKKRAAVFASKLYPGSDKISLRFYVYSDSEDSKKKIEKRDKKEFADSKACTMEKPFKLYNDNKDLTVLLTKLEDGWIVDKTPDKQTLCFDSGYHDAYRTQDYCEFVVKPTEPNVQPFWCLLKFQQQDHTEHMLTVRPALLLAASSQDNSSNIRDSLEHESGVFNESGGGSCDLASDSILEEGPLDTNANQSGVQEVGRRCSLAMNALEESGTESRVVTDKQCNEICVDVGVDWKRLLRKLDVEEKYISIIQEENPRDVKESCYQGLRTWKEIAASQATIGKLARALCAIGKPDVVGALIRVSEHAEATVYLTEGPAPAVSSPPVPKITTV